MWHIKNDGHNASTGYTYVVIALDDDDEIELFTDEYQKTSQAYDHAERLLSVLNDDDR